MQIFATDSDPEKCAQYLDNKRVCKMILESAQLISNSWHFYRWPNPPLKMAMFNHPCSVWARNETNLEWLKKHLFYLLKEYKIRFNKTHSYENKYKELYQESINNQFVKFFGVQFVNCTPHKNIGDIHFAYKITLCEKWARDKYRPKWTNSNEPMWRKNICYIHQIPYS